MILDLAIDEGLANEGIARDVVRAVQQARREAGLHVSDRIRLALELPADWRAAAERFRAVHRRADARHGARARRAAPTAPASRRTSPR